VYAIVHDTFEAGELIVRHMFYGNTKERAWAVYQAHLRSDAFLRGCEERGHYGTVACSTRWRLVELTT
jgi:hypothetical protein